MARPVSTTSRKDLFSQPHGPRTRQPEWICAQQRALCRYLRLLGAQADEVDDLTQEAFVAVLQRYADHGPEEQVRLLRAIARNRFLRKRRRRSEELSDWSDAVDAWLDRSPNALDDARIEQMQGCLVELTPRARLALTLRHIDQRPVDEIADHLGLRRSGTLALLQRSRDLLRACLARRGRNPSDLDTSGSRA